MWHSLHCTHIWSYTYTYIYIIIYTPNCLSVVLVICIAPVPLWYQNDKNASDFLAAHTVGLVTPATWHSESTFGIMFPNKKDQPIVSCLESEMLLKKITWLDMLGICWYALDCFDGSIPLGFPHGDVPPIWPWHHRWGLVCLGIVEG